VGDRVKFVEQDLFQTDLRPATVLTLYLFRELNIKLAPRILEQLRPGARIVSHDWDLGDWTPDHQETMPAPDKAVGISREQGVHVVVPARVEGNWRVETTLPGAQSATLALAALPVLRRHAGRGDPEGRPGVRHEARVHRQPVRRRSRDATKAPRKATRSPAASCARTAPRARGGRCAEQCGAPSPSLP
jgi:hypothetical protein